jgi:T-box
MSSTASASTKICERFDVFEGQSDNGSCEQKINITLTDSQLWTQFHQLTNEMIITKSGRSVLLIIYSKLCLNCEA